MGPWEEALVADGVGAGVRGLFLHSGLVTGEHWVGRGSALQCSLIHLQAQELALSCLMWGTIFQCDPFDRISSGVGCGCLVIRGGRVSL